VVEKSNLGTPTFQSHGPGRAWRSLLDIRNDRSARRSSLYREITSPAAMTLWSASVTYQYDWP
jgi:hypothetical protein